MFDKVLCLMMNGTLSDYNSLHQVNLYQSLLNIAHFVVLLPNLYRQILMDALVLTLNQVSIHCQIIPSMDYVLLLYDIINLFETAQIVKLETILYSCFLSSTTLNIKRVMHIDDFLFDDIPINRFVFWLHPSTDPCDCG